MAKHDLTVDHLHAVTLRVARFHYLYVLLFAAQTVVFHASKVITPELLLKRWVAVVGLALVVVCVWLLAKSRTATATLYTGAIGALIVADVAFAAFNVYTQRGYASKTVLLFVIPIVVATVFAKRSLIFGTTLLVIAAYTTSAIGYFVLNFNEGYMAEMYGEIGFYSGIFIIIASLLWSTSHKHS